MQWKRRTASPSYCVWKALFSPRVYVGYVCSKNQLRENKTNQTPLPSPNLLVPLPITFLSPHMTPLRPSFLTHSTKTYSPSQLTHSARITQITNTQHTTNEQMQNARITEVLVVHKTSLSLRKNNIDMANTGTRWSRHPCLADSPCRKPSVVAGISR